MIDLGWAMARLELTALDQGEGKPRLLSPMLTLCWPGDEDQTSGCIRLWDNDGLHELRSTLSEFLDEYDERDARDLPFEDAA
jgi:hypothetical protein